MTKALIVYGSETGNTLAGSEMIAGVLKDKGITLEMHNVRDVGVDVLAGPYDLILFGVSTWGAIDEEVQQDFLSFYEDMAKATLKGKRVAVFGSGDQGYDHFAKAVDFVEARAREQGAQVVVPSLKFHLHPKKSAAEVKAWAERVAGAIQG